VMLDQAQKMGETLRQELETKAKAQADEIVAQAKREIDVERQRAIQDLRSQVANLAILAAGRIIGESLDAKKHRELIDRAIKEAEIRA
jgi:F-type H+-transporting ATPase subunit b